MKKNIKLFIGIIIGLLLSTVVGVSATILYQADEVGFTPSNPNWNVNNLEDALNDLYSAGGTGGEMLIQNITLTKKNTHQLPLFDGYTWVSDTESISVNSNGLVTVSASGNVFLEKDNVRYIQYSFDYRGPTIIFTSGKYSSYNTFRINNANGITSSVEEYLTDGIKTKQGSAGALMFIGDEAYNYIEFIIVRPCTITFSTGGYADGGGNSANKTVNFYKLNSNNEEELYTTFKTQIAQDYETQSFEPGTYILRGVGRYPEFDEWTIVETN